MNLLNKIIICLKYLFNKDYFIFYNTRVEDLYRINFDWVDGDTSHLNIQETIFWLAEKYKFIRCRLYFQRLRSIWQNLLICKISLLIGLILFIWFNTQGTLKQALYIFTISQSWACVPLLIITIPELRKLKRDYREELEHD